jgi:hypothetical protein
MTRERPVRRDKHGIYQIQSAYQGWSPKPQPLFAGHIRAIAWGLIAALSVILWEVVR